MEEKYESYDQITSISQKREIYTEIKENVILNQFNNILVEFDIRTKDFKIAIQDKNIFISNERVEYFIKKIKEMKNQEDLEKIFKNCSIKYSSDIINIFFENENYKNVIELLEKTLNEAKLKLNDADFPRHPLNKIQTEKVINDIIEKNQKLIKEDKITITAVPLEFKDVENIFNSDRVKQIEVFQKAFKEKISPIINENKNKINFFVITEREKDPNAIKQKHSFLVMQKNNEVFILDSAGHNKYSELLFIPNVEMFKSFIEADLENNKVYYNNTRIQADHVNCFTMAVITLKNILKEIESGQDPIESFRQFFKKQVKENIFREEDGGALPLEFLVSTQLCSLFKNLEHYYKEGEEFNNLSARFEEIRRIREENSIDGYVRDKNGIVVDKKQTNIVNKERSRMLSLP